MEIDKLYKRKYSLKLIPKINFEGYSREKGGQNKVLKVIYKVYINAFLSWRILGELCTFPFCAHIISSCLNDVTSPSSSLHHKNGNKLDFPIFFHHCPNATKLGILECVERCLKTVLMSDEVRYYPMKMMNSH